MTRETWYLTPRDPLVLGDGRGPVPFVERKTHPLPLPGTLAGMVRASFVQDRSEVSSAEALALLDIRVGAPWLVRLADPVRGLDGGVEHHYVFAPADARVAATGRLERAAVIALNGGQDGEGVYWPPGFPRLDHLVLLPERSDDGSKYEVPRRLFWPLGALVNWSLGEDPRSDAFECVAEPPRPADGSSPDGDDPHVPTRPEQRTHVGIDDEAQTADPSILFSSAGQRMAPHFSIAVEVDLPPQCPPGPAAHALGVLGGESRLTSIVRRPAAQSGFGFPPFSDWEGRYRHALEAAKDPLGGIRLQLLSHAFLPPQDGDEGWACLPSWLESRRHPRLPEGLYLRLVALCVPGPLAISGWDLQAVAAGTPDNGGRRTHSGGAPREVRRLVPAGSLYYFALEDAQGAPVTEREKWLDACRCLWWELLDPEGPGERTDETRHRAAAGADGHGRILPGLWSPGAAMASGASVR
ncbi:CRISPR-associated protein (Cas_Cmr3) [Thioflavicoccus mobilis 8321]|uniref:CRISPR-associated protein (Cas_Cmr3) n=1 Tax=Thioflavicoccus mobilis 8321 TaxID=765912 RepID=L0GTP9_9GAMM|nr:CRISPR-associated protein Cmr3 [Thioflavicoccus mobilis]AGA89187.1 CRISPR-associated protein (Cas_Cmr3) [Thioflavicoccus mobilis 8321]